MPNQAPALSARGAQILASGGVSDQQVVKAFATGLPETRTFPVDIWERLHRQALKDYRPNLLLHGDPQGAEPLRQAIADYLNLERGARVTPDQVLVLSSTRQALYLCAQVLVDSGQPILMEDPGYFGARKAFEMAQLKVVPVAVDAKGLCIDALRADRSGANAVYVTPSHQYPTGATLALGTAPGPDRLGRATPRLDHRGRLRQPVSLRRLADRLCAGPGQLPAHALPRHFQ